MAKFYDTLLAEYVKNPWVRWLALDKIAENEMDYSMISYDEVSDKKKTKFNDVELKKASIYSGEDVVITHKLFELQMKDVLVNGVLNDIDLPLMEVIKTIELNWVKINRDRLKEIWTILENEIQTLEKEIHEIAGVEFNIKSPKQVWEILFDTLDLPKWKKTKTWWSVNAEVLENLSAEYPIASKIIDFRHFSKIQSTYVNWLLDLTTLDNDLVHTNYNQAVTATGRLSSTNPNLQNIPSSSWIAWEIRSAFISRFEWGSIMALDYSQVEVRLLAIMSWDENLISAFQNNEDILWKLSKSERIFW